MCSNYERSDLCAGPQNKFGVPKTLPKFDSSSNYFAGEIPGVHYFCARNRSTEILHKRIGRYTIISIVHNLGSYLKNNYKHPTTSALSTSGSMSSNPVCVSVVIQNRRATLKKLKMECGNCKVLASLVGYMCKCVCDNVYLFG